MLSRLRAFLDQWIVSLQSYPITHIVVLAMTIVRMVMIQQNYVGSNNDLLIKLLLTGAMIIPLSVIKFKHQWTSAIPIIIGAIYYLLLPSSIEQLTYAQWLAVIGSIVIAWLIPSLVIAWKHDDSQDLTRSMFGHRWISLAQWVIGGLILWGGIAASLASIEFLFGINITSKVYEHIWVITTLLIGSRLWLINLEQTQELDIDNSSDSAIQKLYPRRMRIFGQYIFLPLCLIYGIILISYGIKILATGVRPQWQLIYMVIGYVWFWLLTWFFLLPLESKNSWLSTAYRALFISFVATSGLMIGAIIMRIWQYGWTIDRALVVAVITWIIGASIGSLIWTSKRWVVWLSSLLALWAISIYTVPTLIQQYQFSQIPVLLTTAQTNTGDASKLYASVDYLAINYGTGWLAQIWDDTIINQVSWSSNRDLARNMMKVLNITDYQIGNPYADNNNQYWSRYSDNQQIMDIAWYNTLIQFDSYQGSVNNITVSGSLITIATWWVNTSINVNNYSSWLNNINDLSPSKESRPGWYTITWDNLKIIITQANGQSTSSGVTIEWFAGYALIK